MLASIRADICCGDDCAFEYAEFVGYSLVASAQRNDYACSFFFAHRGRLTAAAIGNIAA
jgi:hypothetical protein